MKRHFLSIWFGKYQNNYPHQGRWRAVDIYLHASRLGIYPPLFTSPSGNSCILLHNKKLFTSSKANPFLPTWFIAILSCHSYSSSSSSSKSPSTASFTSLKSSLTHCSSTRRGAARSNKPLTVSNTGFLEPTFKTTSLYAIKKNVVMFSISLLLLHTCWHEI